MNITLSLFDFKIKIKKNIFLLSEKREQKYNLANETSGTRIFNIFLWSYNIFIFILFKKNKSKDIN